MDRKHEKKQDKPSIEALDDDELDQVIGAGPGQGGPAIKSLVSTKSMSKVSYVSYSSKVKVEGKAVVRSTDMMTHNSGANSRNDMPTGGDENSSDNNSNEDNSND